jgi:hypothetical protein
VIGADVCVPAEVSINQLHVRTTHPASHDPDENLVGLDVGDRNILEDERFAIFVQACGFHVRVTRFLLVKDFFRVELAFGSGLPRTRFGERLARLSQGGYGHLCERDIRSVSTTMARTGRCDMAR